MSPVLDFLALAQDNRIPIVDSGHHHSHQGWIQTHCPLCTDGTYGYHLGFSLEQGTFNCWRCGGHGVWEVLGLLLHLRNKSEIGRVVSKYQMGRRLASPATVRKRRIKPPPGTGPMNSAHKQYLRKRGFLPNVLAREWGLQGTCHLSRSWNWRIVIPIHNQKGHVVAYVGRAIDDTVRPKYLMSADKDILVDPKSLIYGLHKAKNAVVVVEGPADVWRLGPGAVALLGQDWKEAQASILRKFKKRYIMLDPSSSAQKRAQGLAECLALHGGETEIIDDLSSDPGDFSVRKAERIMRLLGFSKLEACKQ